MALFYFSSEEQSGDFISDAIIKDLESALATATTCDVDLHSVAGPVQNKPKEEVKAEPGVDAEAGDGSSEIKTEDGDVEVDDPSPKKEEKSSEQSSSSKDLSHEVQVADTTTPDCNEVEGERNQTSELKDDVKVKDEELVANKGEDVAVSVTTTTTSQVVTTSHQQVKLVDGVVQSVNVSSAQTVSESQTTQVTSTTPAT